MGLKAEHTDVEPEYTFIKMGLSMLVSTTDASNFGIESMGICEMHET